VAFVHCDESGLLGGEDADADYQENEEQFLHGSLSSGSP
jgi:hypothetical protein